MNKQDLPNVCILAVEGYGEQEIRGTRSLGTSESESESTRTSSVSTKSSNFFMDTEKENSNNNKVKGGDAQNHTNENNNEGGKNNSISEDFGGGVLFRGKRTWSDVVGGATICCNQCCSVLGFASIEEPDTCRLLKHRLCAKDNNNSDQYNLKSVKDWFAQNTSASFIARELIRYAESQAVFTFVIFGEESSPSTSTLPNRALLLKLLSWNTSMGFVTKSGAQSINKEKEFTPSIDDGGVVQMGRIAKVIFEEVDDPNHHLLGNMSNGGTDGTDPMSFSWNVDPCCPPFGGAAAARKEGKDSSGTPVGPKASVHMHLPTDDWKHLREAIEIGRQFIPDSISQATVLMKLGMNGEVTKGRAGLSILQLPFN